MGYIREPKGIDLVIEPSILTDQDRQMISEIIAYYKQTGKLLRRKAQRTHLPKWTTLRSRRKKIL